MKRYTLGSSSIGDLEKQYVAKVLDDNFISPGPVTEEVQRATARMHGLKYGLALNSGQSAIHLAIQAIKETRLSDRGAHFKPVVAVPACTYISTLAAAVLAGCEIVLVDVESPSANMCPKSLKEVLGKFDVDIVVPVHLFGKACGEEIEKICREHNVWVVEDACESTFTPGIGWGHILTTSFFSNHLISAGGGGVIMTNDPALDLYCWKLINHGRSGRFGNDDIHQIAEKFHFDEWGHSMKWSDVPASIAKAQIERKEELYGARVRNAQALISSLEDNRFLKLPDPVEHTFMVFPIVVDPNLNAGNIIHYLNDNGIEVRRMMPITNQPVVQRYFGGTLEGQFPTAAMLNKQGFYVGVHPELTEDDMNEMGDIISEAVRQEANNGDL